VLSRHGLTPASDERPSRIVKPPAAAPHDAQACIYKTLRAKLRVHMHERDGEPPIETPTVLELEAIDDDRMQITFVFERQLYEMRAPQQTESEFSSWLTEYASKTPRCACCAEIIFPGQPITLGHITPEDSGYSHFNSRCNDTAAGYAGSFDLEGELVVPR
jgi:hypothetical protein